MLVILCDGSSKGNPGPASIGVIAWDRVNNPRIIYPNYRYHAEIGIRTNMEAEWEALLSAIKWATLKDSPLPLSNFYKKKEEDIYIFCDSQTVVKQANGIWDVKHENIKPLYEKFLKYKTNMPNLHINWVPRQLIYLADKAATRGVKE